MAAIGSRESSHVTAAQRGIVFELTDVGPIAIMDCGLRNGLDELLNMPAEDRWSLAMTVLGRTICEVLLLVALGVALGSTANAVRGSGSIKWSKNYFAKDVAELDGQPITQKHSPPRGDREQPAQAALVETAQEVNQPSTVTKLEHNYNSVSFEEVVAILNDPATQDGLNVFIDARAAGSYAEGHIPGAIQCFPFEIEKCIDEVLERAEPADKVVVYCTGGDCEDSIFMCRELIAAGLSMNQVFLYEGGWKEWEDNDQPMEKGR